MGLGDEIMALGRAEALFEQTGHPVSICNDLGMPRRLHPAWEGNPAINQISGHPMRDAPGCRPYILQWQDDRIIFNHNYRPRAGRVALTQEERDSCTIAGPFAVVAPFLKDTASPNKSWGPHKWESVIAGFPVPVYQLCEKETDPVIAGARRYVTPSFRKAMAVIEKALIVMCNEGGTHHMAASVGTRAVVIFGAFVPPLVTGYDFHDNIAIDTPEGYCGNWQPCMHCKEAMARITPEEVRARAEFQLKEAGFKQ